ncbi:DL-methionine transporter substrate-binding subunit [Vibrio breoganii]|uniref:Lipoprotein n=1 Tax=Vibrio breoganii TaxID=553239 RepID=A0AAN1CRL9_9VIBR|nr:MetQ/NlpA family lipoprotein [Vibrio breoganii]ANO32284.1 DL-methionine transporter substrate-binding subunit [Vibrio breoganii]OED91727.1 DL-methionine transporter substrate-binding subunit [Vibrio breoganii ZF-55]PMG80681.1 DL-methionine transporter substrate-binding subunit [Vibrio breoganii]PMK40773.1 DL-methionine transporter substrate-binding subunit [Vibrio breoganii]PMK99749.1 DL-methionine transporter substrate-binding subunit [Vibrio breoganii]
MKFSLKNIFTVAIAASALALTGCGDKEQDLSKIKVGVMAGAEAQVAEVAAKVAKEKYDLDVELVTFTDYVTPNAALDDGSVDVNAFQHKPYLDQQIADRSYKLAIAGNTFVYPIAGYSKQIKSVDELEEGARIAVPNDPTNLGRSLLLLEQQGIIELREGAGLLATVRDITANPKNITIVELDAAQLPRSLDDVALSIINTTYASSIDLTPQRDGIFVEDKESPYVNLIVSREENLNAENVQNFVKAYQTEEVYNAASDIFKGGVVKGW